MLISCAFTTQLICGFDFAYAKGRFSHDAAHLSTLIEALCVNKMLLEVNEVQQTKMMMPYNISSL